MLKMVDGTGIIGVDMICPLGVSTPQPPNYDRVELEGTGMLVLPNSLDAPLERLELGGKTAQMSTEGYNCWNPYAYNNLASGPNIPDTIEFIDNAIIYKKNDGTRNQMSINIPFGKLKIGTYKITFSNLLCKLSSNGAKEKGVFASTMINKNGDKIGNTITFAVDDEEAEYSFSCSVISEVSSFVSMLEVIVQNPMLALETKTTYEPYTGGKPSPSQEYQQEIKNVGKWNESTQKYEIEVVLSGKNLLDITACEDGKTLDANGNIVNNANALLSDFIPCFSKTSYCRVEGHFTAVSFYDVEKNKIGFINQYDPCFATPDKCRYFRFSLNKTKADYEKAVANVGTALMDYEPYKKPQTLTLTSDRPITKWDKLVEQGGQIGWLYKHQIIEDFSTLVKDTEPIYGNNGGKFFSVSLQNASLNYDRSKIYSEVGTAGKDSEIYYIPQPLVASTIIHVSDTDTIMTAKERLHYEVIYETESTEFVPLPQSEQAAIRALKTYYPTTVITADGGELDPDIKVTYRKEI